MSSDIKDYIGQKINNFKVLDAKRENKRTLVKIVCPICGKEKWMRLDGVKESVSCGCLKQKNRFSAKDLSNQKFGRLTAIKNTGNKNKKGSYLWEYRRGKRGRSDPGPREKLRVSGERKAHPKRKNKREKHKR